MITRHGILLEFTVDSGWVLQQVGMGQLGPSPAPVADVSNILITVSPAAVGHTQNICLLGMLFLSL